MDIPGVHNDSILMVGGADTLEINAIDAEYIDVANNSKYWNTSSWQTDPETNKNGQHEQSNYNQRDTNAASKL